MSETLTQVQQERFERELSRCRTPAQRQVFTRLVQEGKQAYVAKRTGKRVVAAFKKYVTTMDPQAIDQGLYDWSIYDGPGDIAHYNLHGFRSVYPHPALYMELLLFPWLRRNPEWRSPSVYVYADGMTTLEITDQIEKIANEWKVRVYTNFKERKRRAEIAEAEELAAKHGMKVVPQ